MSDYTKILSKTFTAAIQREYSALAHATPLGTHESTMELCFYTGKHSNRGFIEWDISAIDEYECIGLTFDIDAAGVRTLCDYDGIMCLPSEAVDLMKEAGIVVPDDFDDRIADLEPEERRIRELEAEGMTRSDAQATYEAEQIIARAKS